MVITPILRLFLNPSIRLTKKCRIINGAMVIANKMQHGRTPLVDHLRRIAPALFKMGKVDSYRLAR